MPALHRFLATILLILLPLPLRAEPSADTFVDLSFSGYLALHRLVEASSDPSRLYAISRGGHLLRSADGGRSFVAIGSLIPIGSPDTVNILVDPLDADQLYLVNIFPTEVLRSNDGGFTRTLLDLPAGARGFWLDPQHSERWFSSRGTHLLVHEPGEPWTELPEIEPGSADVQLFTLAIDAQQPQHLLAGLHAGFPGGIYESYNGGLSWSSRLSRQNLYQLSFDPFDANRAWAITSTGGNFALWRSSDGGSSWIEQPLSDRSNSLFLSFDPGRPGHLVIDSAPRHGSEHIYLLSRDDGASWERIALPFGTTSTYRLSLLSDRRWVVTSTNPVEATWAESSDTGMTWQERKVMPSRVLAIALDPQDPEHAWLVNERGVYRSTRGGASWVPVFTPDVPLYTAQLAVDPGDNRVLFFAHSRSTAGPFLWRSIDRGRTWYEALHSSGFISLHSLQVGRRDGQPFALASFDTETFEKILWRSADLGASWQLYPGASSLGMAVDPEDGIVYRLVGNQVEQSLDGGLDFTPVADFSASGVTPVAVVAGSGHHLYAGTSESLYSSPSRLFEVFPGQEPIERFLPSIDCAFYGSLLAPGTQPGQLFFTPNCGMGENLLWASTDSGRSWLPIRGLGLPEGAFRAIAVSRADDSLWVVPEDYGIFRGRVGLGGDNLPLQHHRFEVKATFQDSAGHSIEGTPRYLTDQTGYFAILAPDRIELVVKILDGRPLTGSWWLFYASLTELEFELEVRDLEQGEVKRYHHPAGSLASFSDLGTLVDSPPLATQKLERDLLPVALVGGRFQISVEWHDFSGTTYGNGQSLRLAGDDTVAFHFFRPANLELFVRLVDGRESNGHYWVYVAGLTNVEYILNIHDTWTGRDWVYYNPPGTFSSQVDSEAFPSEGPFP